MDCGISSQQQAYDALQQQAQRYAELRHFYDQKLQAASHEIAGAHKENEGLQRELSLLEHNSSKEKQELKIDLLRKLKADARRGGRRARRGHWRRATRAAQSHSPPPRP